MSDDFFDSNVLIYLLTTDIKAARAEQLVQQGGFISVQVLNEIANVARKKHTVSWSDLTDFLSLVKELLTVEALTKESQALGIAVASRYQLSVYDGQIAASALLAGCPTLWSEDMQHGLVLQMSEKRTTINNPFI